MIVGFTGYSVIWGANRNESGLFTTQTTSRTGFRMDHFNDVGIITLSVTIDFSSSVQPIRLPTYITRENEQGMIVGFGGAPDAPAGSFFAAFPRVTTGTRCLARWPNVNLATQFCAEDERLRSDFCARNIGSALTMLNRGVEEIVGIAIDAHCFTTGQSQPSRYANVMAHRAWILQITGI